MSKDPAFLFYTNDFLTGVAELTMQERGQYITLMCLQHQKGSLSQKLIKMNVPEVSKDVLKKFKKNGQGNLFNERLEEEIIKRKKYSKKQSDRAYKRWHPTANATALPKIEDVNENVIKDETKIKDKVKAKIIFPFQSVNFCSQWEVWKTYKKTEFNFKYKSNISEQAALKKLAEVSDHNEQEAIKIIHESISEGWKGFFKLKTNVKRTSGKQIEYSEGFQQKLADKLQS